MCADLQAARDQQNDIAELPLQGLAYAGHDGGADSYLAVVLDSLIPESRRYNEVQETIVVEMERECAQHKNDKEPNYRTCTHQRFWCCFSRISARDSCGVLISIIVVLQYFIISIN